MVAAVLAVLGAAWCWGALGTSYRLILDRYDVPLVTVVAIRATVAGGALLAYVTLTPRHARELRAFRAPAGLAAVLFAGVVSTAAFYVALIYAFQQAGVAVATVLLYLAPALVAVGARVCFGDRIGRGQWLALALALVGVTGVSGVLDGVGTVRALGVALGLASALCYASYSLVGRALVRRASPVVVVALVLSVGAVALWGAKLAVDGPALPNWRALALIAAVNGVGTTLLPMLLYTWGLTRLTAGRASLLATAEPLVAVGLAYGVLGEALRPTQLAGAAALCAGLVVAGLTAERAGRATPAEDVLGGRPRGSLMA